MALEVEQHILDPPENDRPGIDQPGTDQLRDTTHLDAHVADAFRLDDHSLDDLPIGVLVFLDGEVVRVNDGWTSLTGREIADSKGARWLAAVHPEDRVHAEIVPRLAFGGTDAAGDWRLTRHDGSEVWVHARVRHAKTVNVRTCVITLTEIAAHKANELRLIHLATHDPLTGFRKREAFVDWVDVTLGRAAFDHVTAVLFIDLDRFKVVNDRYGHLCGDKVLAEVAHRLRCTVRPFDMLGRLGGDELGIVCEVATPEDATRFAERIVAAIGEPYHIDGAVLTIGASIGIATASASSSTTSEDLMAEADRAMYRAKEAGGAQWWMNGSREMDFRVRCALTEATATIADVALHLDWLIERLEALRLSTAHLHDEQLSGQLTDIEDALDRASLAALYSFR